MLERQPGQRFALLIAQQELLGKVGEHADAVDALVDHQIENAAHAVEIKGTVIVEWGRRHGPDTGIDCHLNVLS